MLPLLSGVGRLVADPELKFGQSGVAVVRMKLAFSSSKKDASGNWVNDATFFVRAVAFKQMAENAAESLVKGMEVVVTGRLKTEEWEKDGQKHSDVSLMIDSIGPNLSYATAKVVKASRDKPAAGSGYAGGGFYPNQGQNDPYAGSSGGWGNTNDNPPF